MANIKFSAFNTETNSANVDFLVGYQGTTMKKIAPSNLGGYPFLIDGSGSLYSGFVPSGLSGSPSKNTTLGINAGASLTTGFENVYIGYNAGKIGTTANRRIAVGTEAYSNVSSGGQYGISIGWYAGRSSTSNEAINIGRGAGEICSGSEAINIGRDAGRVVISGPGAATNLGYKAGFSQTSATKCTNIGYEAGYSGTTNGSRTMIGYQAGKYNTLDSNVFVGDLAGRGNSSGYTGQQNVAIGSGALANATGGNYNVVIGMAAGDSMTNGEWNTVIGRTAAGSLTTGDKNIVIGMNSNVNGSNAENQIVIGTQATAGPDNSITLGNSSHNLLRIPGLGSTNGHVLTYNSTSGGIVLAAAGGGGGASSLNGLSDCLVDTDSLYVGEVPAGLSGNPQGNTILGIDAGNALTTGTNNTFIGNDAALNITTSNNVVAIGTLAGEELTTSAANAVLIGYRAGSANNSGIGTYNLSSSVAIGMDALGSSGANEMVAIGRAAGQVSTGSQAVLIGSHASWASYNNDKTVSIGYYAGFTSSNAEECVNIGAQAGKANTTDYAVHIGSEAGFSQTSGIRNISIGYQAGYSNTTNGSNTNVGYRAGRQNINTGTTNVGADAGYGMNGGYNTNLGYRAGYRNGTTQAGQYNVYLGALAAYDGMGSSNNNTGIGGRAMEKTTTGSNNTCIGKSSGGYVTTTSDNTFLGYQAGKGKTSGTVSGASNVAIGSDCFTTMVSASNNVVIGYRTLGGVGEQTGNNNTFVGNSIYFNAYFSGSNTTALGNGANPSAQNVSNEITLGNSSIGTLRCQQTSITSLSDQRDKKDIETIPYGLDFVNSLKPKKFVWDNRAETDGEGKEFYSSNKGKKDIGFIAQELQTVDDDYLNLVYDANPEKLEATYGKLIPVLVKAIQDLSAKVTALENA